MGFSPGTRHAGLAIIIDTELVIKDTLVVNLKTNAHRKKIMHYVRQFNVKTVVIKLPPQSLITPKLGIVINAVVEDVQAQGCAIQYADYKSIKRIDRSLDNKEKIIAFATERFPDLIPEQEKEKQYNNKYYIKLFEAVVAAHQFLLTQSHI